VARIDVTDGGANYISQPSVDMRYAGNNWNVKPVASAVWDEQTKTITGITIDNGGDGSMLGTTSFDVLIRGGRGKDAEAYITSFGRNGEINNIFIDEDKQGSGYIGAPTVQIIGGSPAQPAGDFSFTIEDGKLIEIIAGNPGSGYSGPVQVQITGGRGRDARGRAYTQIDGKVTAIEIPTGGGGSGYTQADVESSFDINDWINDQNIRDNNRVKIDAPILTEHPNDPQSKGNSSGIGSFPPQAVARISAVENGSVTGIEVVWSGNGYMSAPTVTVNSPIGGGTVASATAIFKQDGRVGDPQIVQEGNQYLETTFVETLTAREPTDEATPGSTAKFSMYLESPGEGNKYRYNANGLTPDGKGKFFNCIEYKNAVYAFPYNTFRCIKITLDGNWTDTGFDFTLGKQHYASSVYSPERDAVYAIPLKKQRITKLDLDSSNDPRLVYLEDLNNNSNFPGEWIDAALDPASKVIYAVPRNSDYILTIDTKFENKIERIIFPVVSASIGTSKFSSVVSHSWVRRVARGE
jgi:hypothetical protein